MKKIIFFLSLVSLALLVPSQNTDAQSKTQDSDDDLLRKSEQISFVVGGFTVTIDFCSNTPQDLLGGSRNYRIICLNLVVKLPCHQVFI